MKYAIKWRSKLTKKTGEGEAVFTKIEVAREVVRLNRNFPALEHRSVRRKRD